LESPLLVDGDIFVGFQQQSNYYINIGFDRSYNTADHIFYRTSTDWQQSILSGSLMMRPCFGAAATVGIDEVGSGKREVTIYPNPARERVTVSGLPEGSRVELYDAMGRRINESTHQRINVSTIPSGIYLLRCIAPDGVVHTEKLIIRH